MKSIQKIKTILKGKESKIKLSPEIDFWVKKAKNAHKTGCSKETSQHTYFYSLSQLTPIFCRQNEVGHSFLVKTKDFLFILNM